MSSKRIIDEANAIHTNCREQFEKTCIANECKLSPYEMNLLQALFCKDQSQEILKNLLIEHLRKEDSLMISEAAYISDKMIEKFKNVNAQKEQQDIYSKICLKFERMELVYKRSEDDKIKYENSKNELDTLYFDIQNLESDWHKKRAIIKIQEKYH